MQKQFVSREIAILLKKLGFQEPCLGYYDAEGITIMTDQRAGLGIGVVEYTPHTEEGICLMPLWSQVVGWLYKEHNLSVCIIPEFIGYKSIEARVYKHYQLVSSVSCGDPEDAIEKAINCALKFIS